MLEMFDHTFMIRALLGGAIIGSLLATLSVVVVHKNLSFMGAGIAHSAFGGVALGLLVGVDPRLSSLLYCVGVALSTGWFSRKGGVKEEVSVGILFAASMALGVICLGLSRGGVDLASFLFGSILALSPLDLWLAAIAALVVGSLFLFYYKEYFAYCFDEEWAQVCGVNTSRLSNYLLVMIAVAVVVSIKLLGIVLVSALLVIPGAVATLISKSYHRQFFVAIGTALISVFCGLQISFSANLASGATIVLSATTLFIAAALLRPARR